MLLGIHEIHGGTQEIHKFDNNYGASIVKHSFSYGASEGKYEMALLKFSGEKTSEIVYEHDFKQDVIGWLTYEECKEYLNKIEKY